jgi:hypothetical protein
MERPHRFSHLYGYAVCLTAVIVGLISLNNAIEAIFDLSDPAHAVSSSFGGRDVPPTYEVYRAEQRRPVRVDGKVVVESVPSGRNVDGSATTPNEEEMRRIYDARRSDVIATRTFQARRSLASSLLLLLASVALFVWHWRWLRGLREETLSATSRP